MMKFTYTKQKVTDLKEQIGITEDTGAGKTNETIINQQSGNETRIWIGTQNQYDSLDTKDSDTLYMVK